MRVVAVIEAHTVTGPAKNLLRFCRLAAERGECAISVATYLRGAQESNQFIDTARVMGVPVDIIRERNPFDPQVILALKRLFHERAPDIVQTHAVKSHFLGRMSSPSKARWVAYHHGYTNPDFKMRLYNGLDRWSLPAADHVVTVCTPFAEQLRSFGVEADRLSVLANSIESDTIGAGENASTMRARFGIPPSARVLVTVGRLSNEKGHRYLIDALALLGRDAHLVVVGDGPESAALEQQVRLHRLESLVHFAGHQHDVLPFYPLADVFVLPSLTEGSPNVVLEAMRARTPIVATAVGGIPDMVQSGSSGLLVPSQDAAALSKAIGRLLDDGALAAQLSDEAYATVTTRYTPDAYYASLTSIYRKLLT